MQVFISMVGKSWGYGVSRRGSGKQFDRTCEVSLLANAHCASISELKNGDLEVSSSKGWHELFTEAAD